MKKAVKILILLATFNSCNNDFYEIEYLNQDWNRSNYFGSNTSDSDKYGNNFPLKFTYLNENLYTEFYSICPVSKKPIFEYSVFNDTLCILFHFENKFYTSSDEMIEESRPFKTKINIKINKVPKFVYAAKKKI